MFDVLPGPSLDHHGSISIPYEISIPKSEITMRSFQDQDFNHGDNSRSKLYKASMVEPSSSNSLRGSLSAQPTDTTSADVNDSESGFESSSSSTTTVTSWRSQRQNQYSPEDGIPDTKNVTVRSTWRNKGATTGNEAKSKRGLLDNGSEDEAEASTTWRAYRATTFDVDESVNSGAAAGLTAQKVTKPSPAEVRGRVNNNIPQKHQYIKVNLPNIPPFVRFPASGVHAQNQQCCYKH